MLMDRFLRSLSFPSPLRGGETEHIRFSLFGLKLFGGELGFVLN
jgi:hypothetical protein